MNEKIEASMKIKVSHSSLYHRIRRYNTFKGLVWKHLNITYKIIKYIYNVSHAHIYEDTAKALQISTCKYAFLLLI